MCLSICGDIVSGLNLPFPRYDPVLTHDLSGYWRFAFVGEVGDAESLDPTTIACDDTAAVPGVFDATPAYAGRRGVALYRTTFELTPDREAQLRFDGLGLWARVFVDGQLLATHDLPYSGLTVRVPAADRRVRTLDLLVDNCLHPRRTVLVEPYFDFYLYGGVYRGVWLRELVGPSLDAALVTTLDRATGRVRVDLRAVAPPPPDTPLTAAFDDAEPAPVVEVAWCEHTAALELTVPNRRIWSPDDPQLHTLTLRLGDDRFAVRFGLRDVRVDGRRLLLNDEPLKLQGFCRHEAHPQFGPALPDALLEHDVQLLRQLGANFVRGSHYPQDPRFLDLCDENGLLVFEESLGWQPRDHHFRNPYFVDRCEVQTRRMVRTSYNHPSVILWGFLNEGDTHEPSSRPVYERLSAAIRDEDQTRPVTFASNHPYDEQNFDFADVISVNTYPGWYADPAEGPRPLETIEPALDRLLDHLAEQGQAEKPFILSEIGAGAIYGWHDPLRGYWTEGYQADLIDLVVRRFLADERMTGLSIWQFFDVRTYADAHALKRPRAFNNKGVLDEYRRPKIGAAAVERLFVSPTTSRTPPK